MYGTCRAHRYDFTFGRLLEEELCPTGLLSFPLVCLRVLACVCYLRLALLSLLLGILWHSTLALWT